MRVAVTGAFGNVGRSTVKALLEQGDAVACFELPGKVNARLARNPRRLFSLNLGAPGMESWRDRLHFYWGDIRRQADIEPCLAGAQAVCHLAALIPPAADHDPGLAYQVNVGGTRNLLEAIQGMRRKPLLVYASSVAVYGDRVERPLIQVSDALGPSAGDEYGEQKILCEEALRESGLAWIILRLSYVVWRKKLALDPLMFRMPLATRLELCHTEDAGLAFAHATRSAAAAGSTFNIGGGPSCRTTYRDYLERMFSLFGLGGLRGIPERAFSREGYHCGWMDSEKAEAALSFQRRDAEYYFSEVRREASKLRAWARLAAWALRKAILRDSPYEPILRMRERSLRRSGGRPHGARAAAVAPSA